MVVDIPNIIGLGIEIGVAMLILLIDRRSRQRDQLLMQRQQEQQAKQREIQQTQSERFNNWNKEASKRQILLLESIMVSLGNEEGSTFKSEVGNRYQEELTNDIDDLEDLLSKQNEARENPSVDPDVFDNPIQSKLDEITSAGDIARGFLPDTLFQAIKALAERAKVSYDLDGDDSTVLFNNKQEDELSNKGKSQFPNLDPNTAEDGNLNLEIPDTPDFAAGILSEIEIIKQEIAKSVGESTEQITNKIAGMLNTGLDRGLQGLSNLRDKIKKPEEDDGQIDIEEE